MRARSVPIPGASTTTPTGIRKAHSKTLLLTHTHTHIQTQIQTERERGQKRGWRHMGPPCNHTATYATPHPPHEPEELIRKKTQAKRETGTGKEAMRHSPTPHFARRVLVNADTIYNTIVVRDGVQRLPRHHVHTTHHCLQLRRVHLQRCRQRWG